MQPAGMTGAVHSRPRVRLWDWPVRICHWSFVLLLPALWWTADEGMMDRHRQFGHIMLGLVAFRIIWGFVGAETARFSHFLKPPSAVARNARTLLDVEGPPVIGHNPLGGYSVLFLLLALLTQASIGLFAQDVDGIESGSLAHLVSYETADAARGLHHRGFNVVLALVTLHLCAIGFYLLAKGENLIGPMVGGWKEVPAPVLQPRPASLGRALGALVAAGGLSWWLMLGAPPL